MLVLFILELICAYITNVERRVKMTHEQKKDIAERNGFYDIAFIQLTSTKHPYLDKVVKHYYRLFRLSPHGPLHVTTVIRSDDFIDNENPYGVQTIERLVTNAQVKKNGLKSLSSRRVRTEIARAIVDMHKNISFTDKASLRDQIIEDARYMVPPYRLQYVNDGEFATGTIINIWYDVDEGANRLQIEPDGLNKTTVKHHGEVNIPFKQLRCMHES
jgi:hypothetical protein